MEILKKLKEQGWYLTEDGLKKITDAEAPGSDIKKIIAAALNWDFREIAGGALPTKREDTLPGRIVLQVQKIRNIAAPKANEESKVAPRFLQIDLSDGQTLLQGLELESIPALSLNLAPGTKIYLRAERLQLMQGFAVLKTADVQVLGGRVEQLAEKWELARTMMKYARSGRRISGSSGPPPWIAFGKKLEVKETLDARNFKSLQAAQDKDKDASKENEEFKAMRTEAIAEAAKAGSKKVFGGGNQQIVDHNVKKILEKGYNEEEAKQALRNTNNNLERALYNLKRRDDYKRSDDKARNSAESAPAGGRFGRSSAGVKEFGGKRGVASAKEEAAAAKPAANVSLFDFLTEKLPANTDATRTENVASAVINSNNNANNSTASNTKLEKSKSDVVRSNHSIKTAQDSSNSSARPKFENNLSSSFAANRTPGAPRGSGGRGEREPYNALERQSSSRNNDGGRGGGGRGRGGRGGGFQGGNRSSYDDTNNRGGYQQRREGGGADRNGNSNNNSGNRSNRNSHERSTAGTNVNQSGNDKSQAQLTVSYDNRRQPQDNQNKGYEKSSRYNQKDQSNNRREGSYTTGNNVNVNSNTNSNNNMNNSNNKIATASSTNNSNNNQNSSSMNKLIESTSKLKIGDKTRESGRNQQRQQNQRSQQQQQQQHQNQSQKPQQNQHQQQQHKQQQQYSSKSQQQYSSQQQQQTQQLSAMQQYSAQPQMLLNNQSQSNFGQQLPNGYTYDPSKIIGFQSKETNEFAMTLLKNQGLVATTAPPSESAPTTATHYMPTSAAAPLQMPQQQQQPFNKPAAFVLPTVQATSSAPPPSAQNNNYGMMQPAGDNWMWKIGDICLAKYWDDGRYYEAEITGVSDKTCVVFFRGYGNHEEVLQSDCLPITDANHRPINHYNSQNQQQQQQQQLIAALQQQAPPQSNMHLNNSGQSRPVSNRYRGERQVYVPPPKREN